MMYGSGDMKKPCAHIQITDAKEAKGLNIGETVSLTITGKVKAIEGPREDVIYRDEGSESRMMPGGVEIELTGMKIGAIESADKEND